MALRAGACIASCDNSGDMFGDHGCNGGGPATAFTWIINNNNGGMAADAAYPYTSGRDGDDGKCQHDDKTRVAFIKEFIYLPAIKRSEGVEGTLLAALQKEGIPISISVNVNGWTEYTGGIMTTPGGKGITHSVLLVGYGITPQRNWIVRNLWGADWGKNGYVRLAYGSNVCDIVTCFPTFFYASGAPSPTPTPTPGPPGGFCCRDAKEDGKDCDCCKKRHPEDEEDACKSHPEKLGVRHLHLCDVSVGSARVSVLAMLCVRPGFQRAFPLPFWICPHRHHSL